MAADLGGMVLRGIEDMHLMMDMRMVVALSGAVVESTAAKQGRCFKRWLEDGSGNFSSVCSNASNGLLDKSVLPARSWAVW
jgi:hypothetical protein